MLTKISDTNTNEKEKRRSRKQQRHLLKEYKHIIAQQTIHDIIVRQERFRSVHTSVQALLRNRNETPATQ
jgi:hypothetical protein